MKRILSGSALAIFSTLALATTYVPVQMLNPLGSTSGQTIVSTGPSTAPAWGSVSATALTGIVPVANGGTNASTASGTALDNVTGFAGTGFLKRTGAGAYSFIADPLPITNGGTGATTATAARTNIGAAASGANTDIASLNAPSLGAATAPTATFGTNTTQVATTAFVANQAAVRNQPFFQAYLSANQTFTAGTLTKVPFNTKNFDSGTNYDATTNYRYNPQIAGKYLVTVHLNEQGTSTAAQYGVFIAAIYKNGASVAKTSTQLFYNASSLTIGSVLEANAIVQMNGTTDYIEGLGTITTVGSTQFNGGSDASYIQAFYIGP